MPAPEILKRLTRQLRSRGLSNAEGAAQAALVRNGLMRKGTTELTAKGRTRNSMSPAERAKDRAAKASNGHKASEYKYNPQTNRARLKRK